MTKKELKQIEEAKRQKFIARQHFVDSLKNYYGDLEAIRRVNRINGEDPNKIDYEKVIGRYPALTENGFKQKFSDDDVIESKLYKIFSCIRRSQDKYELPTRGGDYDRLEKNLKEHDLWLDDAIHSDDEVLVLFCYMRKFGYDNLVFTDTSTAAMDALASMVEIGGVITGVNRKGGRGGFVINIESIVLPMATLRILEREKQRYINTHAGCVLESRLKEIEDKYKKLYDLAESV